MEEKQEASGDQLASGRFCSFSPVPVASNVATAVDIFEAGIP